MTKSYIVVSKETGKPIFETFNQKVTENVNLANYEVYEAGDWLRKFNEALKTGTKTPENPSK